MLALPVPVVAHVTDIKFLKTTNRYKNMWKTLENDEIFGQCKEQEIAVYC